MLVYKKIKIKTTPKKKRRVEEMQQYGNVIWLSLNREKSGVSW